MIDWTKPIQTRVGNAARFLGVLAGAEAPCPYVVAVASLDDGGAEGVRRVGADGRFLAVYQDHSMDIVQKRKKVRISRWALLFSNPGYRDGEPYLGSGLYDSQAEAEQRGNRPISPVTKAVFLRAIELTWEGEV